MNEAINSHFYLISVEGIDETQAKQIQAQVSNRAQSWWHQQQNLWIVQGGKDQYFWRDLLMPIFQGVAGEMFVFTLPGDGARAFAAFARSASVEWLRSEPFMSGSILEIEGSSQNGKDS